MAKLKSMPTFAVYDGKVVDLGHVPEKQRFHIACCRVTDNVKDGYVVEGRTVYTVSQAYKRAKIVRDETVKAEILAKLPAEG